MPNASATRSICLPSLHAIERSLRRRLVAIGRDDLARRALAGVRFTDDGSTYYVLIFRNLCWRGYRAGDVYPLAFADHPELCSLANWRAFTGEAALLLNDDFDRIVSWLDG